MEFAGWRKALSKLVSIIIPLFNKEKYISETIESAFSQDYPNIEIIVVDDGSTDQSLEIVQRYKGKIQIHTQVNQGAPRARNFGFRKSKGEYIQFLDADDILGPKKISSQVGRLTGEQFAIATCPWVHDNEALESRKSIYKDFECSADLLHAIWSSGEFFNPASWLLPRDIVEKAGPWDEELLVDQDGEYFARVLLQGCKVLFAEKGFCTYTKPSVENVSNLNSYEKKKSLVQSLEKSVRIIQASKYKRRLGRACLRRIRAIGYRVRDDELLISKISKLEQEFKKRDLNLYCPLGYNVLCSVFGVKNALKIRNIKQSFSMIKRLF